MLEHLDTIAWNDLTHAYGKAGDVPAQIRDLLSKDSEKRKAAFNELFTNIWHQGSVYEATVHAVSFLIEILAEPETPDRDTVALLVAEILAGRGYYEAHYTGEPMINPFTRKPLKGPADVHERIEKDRQIVLELRRRGAPAVDLLVPYLTHVDVDLRSSVARALPNFPEASARTIPAIREALSREEEPQVRARLTKALEALVGGLES